MAVVAAPLLNFATDPRPADIPNNGIVAESSIHPVIPHVDYLLVVAAPLPSVFFAGGSGGGESSYPIAG